MSKVENLTKSEQAVYNFLLAEHNNLENIKISDISKACYCSSTTIHRTLRKAGYSSFRELKHKLKKETLISTSIMNDLILIERSGMLKDKKVVNTKQSDIKKEYVLTHITLHVSEDSVYVESLDVKDQQLYYLLISKLSN